MVRDGGGVVVAMEQQRVARAERARLGQQPEDLRLLRRDEAQVGHWLPFAIKVLRVDVAREAVRVVAPRDGDAAVRHAARDALVHLDERRYPQTPARHQLHVERLLWRRQAKVQVHARRVVHGRRCELLVVYLQREPLVARARSDRKAKVARGLRKVQANGRRLARARPRVDDLALVAHGRVGAL